MYYIHPVIVVVFQTHASFVLKTSVSSGLFSSTTCVGVTDLSLVVFGSLNTFESILYLPKIYIKFYFVIFLPRTSCCVIACVFRFVMLDNTMFHCHVHPGASGHVL